jgi:penicillin-binding protein 1C
MAKIKTFLLLAGLTMLVGTIFAAAAAACAKLEKEYSRRESAAVFDRSDRIIFLRPNNLGYYSVFAETIPDNVKKLILAKEDRFFYWHFGVNPISILENLGQKTGFSGRTGSSTITQQTAKILLGNENRRTVSNIFLELLHAVALELVAGKNKIFNEYANSIYFGNRIQGVKTASLAYFGAPPEALTDAEVFQLLAAISDPSGLNPASERNVPQAASLAKKLSQGINSEFTPPEIAKKNLNDFFAQNSALFELIEYLACDKCQGSQQTTLDAFLNEKLRQIVFDNIAVLDVKKAKNAAAVVILLPENEILAFSGSPDPASSSSGYQINMLEKPRQIGSTIKPFIYLEAFKKGMRPYTLIDDREYKYSAGSGFSIYPENYDRKYHGLMTAHYALANSINVAAAKTLEFVGIEDFGIFINESLGLKTQQKISDYQMGIALGTMETDIISLAQAFTIFLNQGILKNLTLFNDLGCDVIFFPRVDRTAAKSVYVQLVNKILADRAIAQDQFGSQSVLNLPADNYALKTGTSHDYTDSWVIGYTPDFLAAVWVGNADGSAMEGVSGQVGAGKIWADIMQMMLATPYNKKTPFDFADLVEFRDGNNIQYGLKNDDYERSKNIIESDDDQLILKPHDGDAYEFAPGARVNLKAKQPALWKINGKDLGISEELVFSPPAPGDYKISARVDGKEEEIIIFFDEK